MMRAIVAGTACLVSVLLGSREGLACDISFRDVRNVAFTGAQDYQVFSAAEAGQVVQFSVRAKQDEPPCRYFVTFSRGGSSTFDRRMTDAASELRYQVYDSPSKMQVLKDLPDAVEQEVMTGRFSRSNEAQTHSLSYFVAVPALQLAPPGSYRDEIVMRLYEGTLNNYIQRDWATVRLRADVTSSVAICLGCDATFDENAQTYEMNFGVLEEGETRGVIVRARSNDGYRISMSSEYRGVLRHLTDTDFIPYVLTLNGAAVDLSAKNVEVTQRRGVTAANGDALALQVRIGPVQDLTAGDYRDHVTITVAAH